MTRRERIGKKYICFKRPIKIKSRKRKRVRLLLVSQPLQTFLPSTPTFGLGTGGYPCPSFLFSSSPLSPDHFISFSFFP